MSMEVTDDLVRHVARLSRLAIGEEEALALRKHFEKILSFISAFQDLDTAAIDPSIFSVESSNVYRNDEPKPSLARDEALANAPQADGTYFVVPRIVGEGASGGTDGSGDDPGEAGP